MNKILIKILFLLIFASCGGGGGGENMESNTPTLPNINQTIQNITIEEGNLIALNIPNNISDFLIEKESSLGSYVDGNFVSNGMIGNNSLIVSFLENGLRKKIIFNIVVIAENNAPEIRQTEFFIQRGNGAILDFDIVDENISSLNYIIKRFPTTGTLYSFMDGGLNKIGYDSIDQIYSVDFDLEIIDEGGKKDFKTIVINIIGPNLPPYFLNTPITYELDEDNSVNITYSFIDPDGDPIIHSISSQPNHGGISGEYPNYIYTPNLDYFGQDSFIVRINDGKGGIANSEIILNINPINDIPLSSDKVLNVFKNSSFNVLDLEIQDPDDTSFTFLVSKEFEHAYYFINSEGFLTYIPDLDFEGQDSLIFRVSDGKDISPSYTIVANVQEEVVTYPINIANKVVNLNKNEITEFTLDISEYSGELTYQLIKEPINGSLFIEENLLIYIPQEDFIGNDLIELRVVDSEGNISNNAVISLIISEKNFNLYGFDIDGRSKREEDNISFNKFSLSLESSLILKDNFDFYLNNAVDCLDKEEKDILMVNIFQNSIITSPVISNYSLDLTNSTCENDKFSVMESGDKIVSAGNEFYLFSQRQNVYLGVDKLLIDSFNIMNITIDDSLIKLLSLGSMDFLNTSASSTLLISQEEGFIENSSFLKVPNGVIEYEENGNQLQNNYYVKLVENEGVIRSRGVFVLNTLDNNFKKINTIKQSCDVSDEVEYVFDEDYTQFVELSVLTLEQMEQDSRILFVDESTTNFEDEDGNLIEENLPPNIEYILLVEDVQSYNSIEDIQLVLQIKRSECTNGFYDLDISENNGVLIPLENKLILKLDSKFGEILSVDENENPITIIGDKGPHIILYEYE